MGRGRVGKNILLKLWGVASKRKSFVASFKHKIIGNFKFSARKDIYLSADI